MLNAFPKSDIDVSGIVAISDAESVELRVRLSNRPREDFAIEAFGVFHAH
jgi:hypothetical protein